MTKNSSTLFFGANVIVGDGSDPVEGTALLVKNGLIVGSGSVSNLAVPDDVERVDLTGSTIMPTIVNPHIHAGYLKGASTEAVNFSRENILDHLRRFVYYGVSVVQSLGTDRDDIELTIRNEQRSGALNDPELALLFSASRGIAAPTPGQENGGAFFAPDAILEAATPEQGREHVRLLVEKNPDVIKFWVDDRNGTKVKMTPDVYAAIIDEAHLLGKKVIAHIYELDDAKGVVRAGVDGTAHMVRAPGPDEELLALMTANDSFVFTSMSIQKMMVDGDGWLDDAALAETVDAATRQSFKAMIGQASPEIATMMTSGYRVLEAGLLQYHNAGVRVLLSGDTGVISQFPGFAEHRELEAMVLAGMPAADAIVSATLLPAQMLGLDDRGSLEVGKRADFIVLEANPLDDISNTKRIADVYIAGSKIDRGALRAGFQEEHHV
ncbi:amidohydrolase family protein [Subtercola endophyticus]|uniref:amidohydrolase family protein n=1 Tax=Subtercola endophyticus TaxID=2895559 RepID=UPI001E49175A|nr:amidohydrolase family protein [Subtercola endophyticus]UFS58742.1 amidohydrolase family protein [Subtercola endophyticus]